GERPRLHRRAGGGDGARRRDRRLHAVPRGERRPRRVRDRLGARARRRHQRLRHDRGGRAGEDVLPLQPRLGAGEGQARDAARPPRRADRVVIFLVAFLWGWAEATLFFIVPDFLLTLI